MKYYRNPNPPRTGNPTGKGPSRFTDEDDAWGVTGDNLRADYLGFYVRMAREKYLRLAAPLTEPEKNAAVAAHMATGGKAATPILYVAIPPEWEDADFSQPASVKGHEGRNRMTALPPHTIENVLIIPYGGGWRARHITPSMVDEMNRRLIAQRSDRVERDNFAVEPYRTAERTGNPRGAVKIPPYLRTEKLRPYIEQGLITQQIVDLYEEAFEQMNLFLDLAEEKRKRMSDFGITRAESYSDPRLAGFSDERISAHYERICAIYDELLQAVDALPLPVSGGWVTRRCFPYLSYPGYNEPDDMSRYFANRIMQSVQRSRQGVKKKSPPLDGGRTGNPRPLRRPRR